MSGRKGLVKYALQHGYALTPVYTFGENRTYWAFSGLLRLRLWINSFQVRVRVGPNPHPTRTLTTLTLTLT